ncbi:beta-aspartyl-peptidase [Lewinellaceae bacterium SD302]|nr:beta-aspartyl-peptidase [Lewinellaceae bacterium SD302]
MRYYFILLLLPLFACNGSAPTETPPAEETKIDRPEYALVIHGGAGTILKENMTDERAAAIRNAMETAMQKGEEVLSSGGSAAEAVEQTIWLLEDSPYFNAGKGAVFTSNGTNEMDASFMTGHDLNAGAVGGITNVKHPISAARAVLEKSEHVMLSGKGAEQFAEEQELEIVDPRYFYTEERYQSLQRVRAKEEAAMEAEKVRQSSTLLHARELDEKYGTVGCVALDKNGNIAAGTSTGGMTNKRYNRIGDSPIIGAGTYANNATCGISCTGHGEFFIRYAVAHDVHARMAYGSLSLKEAADQVIFDELKPAGGTGGLIALDKNGNITMPFNTPGMYRGFLKSTGEKGIFFYED